MQRSEFDPRLSVDTAGVQVVSGAGGVVLVDAVRATGLVGRSAALVPWRRPHAVHDPAKVICDLAVTLAFGWGLPGRHRVAARRTGRLRPCRLRSDCVAHHRRARPGTRPRCPHQGSVSGVEVRTDATTSRIA